MGNISWGGTGKTPVVGWLLGWAAQKKLKAVVLSRGYKGKPPALPFLVEACGSPLESGDEPLMLAKLFPGASVLVDPVRSRAVRFAEKTLSPGLFVLDDGFQHLGVSRDLNILLLTPDDLGAGWNRVIPGGTWRENSGALADAGGAEDERRFCGVDHQHLHHARFKKGGYGGGAFGAASGEKPGENERPGEGGNEGFTGGSGVKTWQETLR